MEINAFSVIQTPKLNKNKPAKQYHLFLFVFLFHANFMAAQCSHAQTQTNTHKHIAILCLVIVSSKPRIKSRLSTLVDRQNTEIITINWSKRILIEFSFWNGCVWLRVFSDSRTKWRTKKRSALILWSMSEFFFRVKLFLFLFLFLLRFYLLNEFVLAKFIDPLHSMEWVDEFDFVIVYCINQHSIYVIQIL